MTERDPLFEAHDRRWQELVCPKCGKAMNHERPLSAWDPDHVEGDDMALAPGRLRRGGTVWVVAVVVHPECVGEQE